MSANINQGDAIKWAWQYEGPRFHALLCDPPYELGFMGKNWDRSGVAFNPATWEAFYQIMLPGAFGMAFASSRGWHRLACAIEDAGFVIHPSLFGWAYGSGFPKATRIDTQIDRVRGEMGGLLRFTKWFRACGASRKQVTDVMIASGVITENGTMAGHYYANSWDGQPAIPTRAIWKVIRPLCGDVPAWVDELVERIEAEREVIGKGEAGFLAVNQVFEMNNPDYGEFNITAPSTPLAQSWAGHRYGLQALKPALEPIICFQRPYEGRPLDCITETGAGALWIDGGRVEAHYTESERRHCWSGESDTPNTYSLPPRPPLYDGERHNPLGRWPANFLLLDDEAAQALDRQSGEIAASARIRRGQYNGGVFAGGLKRDETEYSDSGGASRFFFRVSDQLDDADPVRYQAKASREQEGRGVG